MEATELRAALQQFTGTTQYYRHPSGVLYTDGVKFLADSWGVLADDLIASWQPIALRDAWLRELQFSELFVYGERTARAVCSRDSEDRAFCQRIAETGLPLQYLKLYVESDTILLPSEH